MPGDTMRLEPDQLRDTVARLTRLVDVAEESTTFTTSVAVNVQPEESLRPQFLTQAINATSDLSKIFLEAKEIVARIRMLSEEYISDFNAAAGRA